MNRVCHFVSFLIVLTWLVSCTPSPPYTAAGAVAGSATAHPAIITTAQADQYRRDAEATVQAYQILLPEAEQAIHYLAHLYELLLSRFAILRQAGASTWGRLEPAPAPRLLAVVDEFANLADSLPTPQREELWRYARMIAAEGRKAGVHLALALQDPTHKSLDLRIRPTACRCRFGSKMGMPAGWC